MGLYKNYNLGHNSYIHWQFESGLGFNGYLDLLAEYNRRYDDADNEGSIHFRNVSFGCKSLSKPNESAYVGCCYNHEKSYDPTIYDPQFNVDRTAHYHLDISTGTARSTLIHNTIDPELYQKAWLSFEAIGALYELLRRYLSTGPFKGRVVLWDFYSDYVRGKFGHQYISGFELIRTIRTDNEESKAQVSVNFEKLENGSVVYVVTRKVYYGVFGCTPFWVPMLVSVRRHDIMDGRAHDAIYNDLLFLCPDRHGPIGAHRFMSLAHEGYLAHFAR